MSRDSCAVGHRFTQLEGLVQVGHCLSLIHKVQCESFLVVDSNHPALMQGGPPGNRRRGEPLILGIYPCFPPGRI